MRIDPRMPGRRRAAHITTTAQSLYYTRAQSAPSAHSECSHVRIPTPAGPHPAHDPRLPPTHSHTHTRMATVQRAGSASVILLGAVRARPADTATTPATAPWVRVDRRRRCSARVLRHTYAAHKQRIHAARACMHCLHCQQWSRGPRVGAGSRRRGRRSMPWPTKS